MAVRMNMSLAKKIENTNSTDQYYFQNCELKRIGLYGRFLDADQAVGIGLLLHRIIEDRKCEFVKIIDPIVTPRLRNAFVSKKKFRNLDLEIQDRIGYRIKFNDLRVVSFIQKFEHIDSLIGPIPLLMDVFTIEAESVDPYL